MTLTDARNTSFDLAPARTTATPALHQQRQQTLHQHGGLTRQHGHSARDAYLSRAKEHEERTRLGSKLNGLDQILESARRRALLAATLE